MSEADAMMRDASVLDVVGRLHDGRAQSLPEVVTALSGRGVAAYVRRVDPPKLHRLPAGTVVASVEGVLGVVRDISGRSVGVDFGSHVERLAPAEVASRLMDHVVVWEKRPSERGVLARIASTLLADGRVRRSVVAILTLSILAQGLALLVPLLSRQMAEVAIPHAAVDQLMLLALGLVIVGAHGFGARLLRCRAVTFLEAATEMAVVREGVRRLLHRPALRFGASSAEVPTLMGHAAEASILATRVLAGSVDAILGTTYLFVMAWIDPLAAGIVAAISVVHLAGVGARELRVAGLRRIYLERVKEQVAFLGDVAGGLDAIKLLGAEASIHRMWLGKLRLELAASAAIRRRTDLRAALDGLVDRSIYVVLLLLGGLAVMRGGKSVGALFALLQLGAGWVGVLTSITARVHDAGAVTSFLRRLRELGEPPPALDPIAPRADFDAPAVVVDRVSVRYSDVDPWVLQDVSLVVPAGARCLLRWESGRGKTTLLRLICGLVPPERGEVSVLGGPAGRAGVPIAYLPQTASLLPFTLRENLKVFSDGCSPERLRFAMRETGLDELVASLPLGLDTPLPMGSRSLSTGQAHLVLLTAVLASRAPLLLLDEVFANIDDRRMHRILASELISERAVILVTHEAREAFGPSWEEIAARPGPSTARRGER